MERQNSKKCYYQEDIVMRPVINIWNLNFEKITREVETIKTPMTKDVIFLRRSMITLLMKEN